MESSDQEGPFGGILRNRTLITCKISPLCYDLLVESTEGIKTSLKRFQRVFFFRESGSAREFVSQLRVLENKHLAHENILVLKLPHPYHPSARDIQIVRDLLDGYTGLRKKAATLAWCTGFEQALVYPLIMLDEKRFCQPLATLDTTSSDTVQLIRRQLREREAVDRVIQQMVNGLTYLHEQGTTLGYLSPQNVYLVQQPGEATVFKLQIVILPPAVLAYVNPEEMHYVAPDHGIPRYAKASDIYSLGVVMWEMLVYCSGADRNMLYHRDEMFGTFKAFSSSPPKSVDDQTGILLIDMTNVVARKRLGDIREVATRWKAAVAVRQRLLIEEQEREFRQKAELKKLTGETQDRHLSYIPPPPPMPAAPTFPKTHRLNVLIEFPFKPPGTVFRSLRWSSARRTVHSGASGRDHVETAADVEEETESVELEEESEEEEAQGEEEKASPPSPTSIVDYHWYKSYNLGKALGCGAFGCVYSSKDETMAIKLVAFCIPNREHATLLLLDHINITKLLKYHSEWLDPEELESRLSLFKGSPILLQATIAKIQKQQVETFFFGIELCGHNLREWLKDDEADNKAPDLLRNTQARIIIELLCGMEYLHHKKLIHRDLKPENVMFSMGAYLFPIKIGDFGLSRTVDGDNPHMTSNIGTSHYRAPETGTNKYSFEADVYSLGVMFWEIVENAFSKKETYRDDIYHLKYDFDAHSDEVFQSPPPFENFKTVVAGMLTANLRERISSIPEVRQQFAV